MPARITAVATHEDASFGKLKGTVVHGVEIPLPERIGPAELATIRRDFELMLETIQQKPESFSEVLSAATAGDFAAASAAAARAGMTEAAFVARGGGIWLAVAIGVAILLYSQEAY